MTNYQIPKEKVEVSVTLQSGPTMDGWVFLTRDAVGRLSLVDMLNDSEERFFPFQEEDGAVSLIAKNMVVFMKDNGKSPPDYDLYPMPLEITVFFANGDDLIGLIYSDMPVDTLRASDYINRREKFMVIFQGKHQVIMNADQILYISD